ncbi:MAG: NifU family protein [Rickettsiaceae bacterium]|nr:NifU family protein [Rickettsiaceae bacterium]
MFIRTEATPNPNALKFLPDTQVSLNGPVFFNTLEEARGKSLLAIKLFAVEGVKSVFYGQDFITITKEDESHWDFLKPEILTIIMDYIISGLPIIEEKIEQSTASDSNISSVEKEIIEIIETRVRPSVAMDGGDIIYKGFENGIVYLQLRGACSGCPSSSITLKNGIESMLQHFVPEVKSVEALEE